MIDQRDWHGEIYNLGELDANSYIFAVAGGMFLYISLVDMVPELNETVEEASRWAHARHKDSFCLQSFNPFYPDCKTIFSRILKHFFFIFPFLRPEHDCYARFTCPTKK